MACLHQAVPNCSVCGQTFDDEIRFLNHMMEKHGFRNPNVGKPDRNSRGYQLFRNLNTNFEIKNMHKPHLSKCKCEECLHKALEYVVKGTGLDPNSEK